MLRPSEREKLHDCLLLVQSARGILAGFRDDGVVPELAEIQKCFHDADRVLSELLRS